MSQLFPKWSNYAPFLLLAGGGGGAIGAIFVVFYWFSPYHYEVGYMPEQPVPFSHALHAGELGMDCRYCHSYVEKANHSNVPATQTCMACHSQVKTDSPKLAKIRESYAEDKPVEWIYIHKLPDYSYFSHQAHVAAGVGCTSCHGRIDQMEVVWQEEPLSMGWCLECHREPENHLRPVEEVTNMNYQHKMDIALKIKEQKKINPPEHCSGCHR